MFVNVAVCVSVSNFVPVCAIALAFSLSRYFFILLLLLFLHLSQLFVFSQINKVIEQVLGEDVKLLQSMALLKPPGVCMHAYVCRFFVDIPRQDI